MVHGGAYQSFLDEHGEEYGLRSRSAERLYRSEIVVGRFEAEP